MRCTACGKELPDEVELEVCPYCGQAVRASLGVSGLAVGAKEDQEPGADKDTATGITKPERRAPSPVKPLQTWLPDFAKVERWVRRETSVDDVLGLDGGESWEEIQSRWQKLVKKVSDWERSPRETKEQRLGQEASNSIVKIRDRFSDEKRCRAFLLEQRQERLFRKYWQRLSELTRDGALQVSEWETLVNDAQLDGYGLEDLRALVTRWAAEHPQVRIGIRVGPRLLLTEREVVEQWDREGPEALLAVDRELVAGWIESCVGDGERARLWREGRVAEVAWLWGSQVCWLGKHRLENVREWVVGFFKGELEDESVGNASLLADWLELVHRRKDLADLLRRISDPAAQNARRLVWEVAWALDDGSDPKLAYHGTSRLVQADPEFVLGLRQHVRNCARTDNKNEGLRFLESMLKKLSGSEDFLVFHLQLTRDLRTFARFWPEAQKVLEKHKPREALPPFKFREGQAQDISELLQLCDQFPGEAGDYLVEGRLEQWLNARGEAVLAQEARQAMTMYRSFPRRALELFVRTAYRLEGREGEGLPDVAAEPQSLDLGKLPVGAPGSAQVQLTVSGRGHVWGEVTVRGDAESLRGLRWTEVFDGTPAIISVKLDTTRYKPGKYSIALVVKPEGLSTLEIPIRWEVTPVKVSVNPDRLDFGSIAEDSVAGEIVLEPATPGGMVVVDRVTPDPELEGLRCERLDGGEKNGVKLVWDIGTLARGERYKTDLIIETNIGSFSVPVSLYRAVPWRAIWLEASFVGAVGTLTQIILNSLWRGLGFVPGAEEFQIPFVLVALFFYPFLVPRLWRWVLDHLDLDEWGCLFVVFLLPLSIYYAIAVFHARIIPFLAAPFSFLSFGSEFGFWLPFLVAELLLFTLLWAVRKLILLKAPFGLKWPAIGFAIWLLAAFGASRSVGVRAERASPTPQPAPTTTFGRVTESRVRLREGPGTDSRSVALLPLGTRLRILATRGDWCAVQVEGSGAKGWVAKRLIEVEGATVQSQVPAPSPWATGSTASSSEEAARSPASAPGKKGLQAVVLEDFDGLTLGYETGITYARSPGGLAAVFSRGSRIEYSLDTGIPRQGTLEWIVKIDNGYRYENYKLITKDAQALLFGTDCMGGDVCYPGAAKLILGADGSVTFIMGNAKYGPYHYLRASHSRFSFGDWHAVGISFGSEGNYVMVDGELVASDPAYTQELGAAGTHEAPLTLPTIGDVACHHWNPNQYNGGFEGLVDQFRVSPVQRDWQLSARPPAFVASQVEQASDSNGRPASSETGLEQKPSPGAEVLPTPTPTPETKLPRRRQWKPSGAATGGP